MITKHPMWGVLFRNKAILVLRLPSRIHTSVFVHCQSNYTDMNDVQPVTATPDEVTTPVVPAPEVVEGDETVAPAPEAPATEEVPAA
jgi:hypothetical protein